MKPLRIPFGSSPTLVRGGGPAALATRIASMRVAGFLALLAAAAPAPGQATGAWSRAAPLPVIQSEWDGVAIGDSLFVVGGEVDRRPRNDPSRAANDLWIYDGKAERWTQGADMPGGRNHHAVAALDGRLYVFGGYDFSCCANYPWPYGSSNAWRYDPKTDAWKALAPMPRRMGAGSAAAFGGRLYVFAGTDSGAFHSVTSVHEYDPAADAWRARAPMRHAREHAKAAVVDSLIWLIGGHQKPGSRKLDQDAVEAYSPRSDTWYEKGSMPAPRGGVGVAYVGGRIHVFGGEGADYSLFDRVDRLDPATGRWDLAGRTPSGGIHGLATLVLRGRVHLVGGASPAGFNPRDWHDVYAPAAVGGCTDPASPNFDRYATRDDGTCLAASAATPAVAAAPPRAEALPGRLRLLGMRGGPHAVVVRDAWGRVLARALIAGETGEIPLPGVHGLVLARVSGAGGRAWTRVAVIR